MKKAAFLLAALLALSLPLGGCSVRRISPEAILPEAVPAETESEPVEAYINPLDPQLGEHVADRFDGSKQWLARVPIYRIDPENQDVFPDDFASEVCAISFKLPNDWVLLEDALFFCLEDDHEVAQGNIIWCVLTQDMDVDGYVESERRQFLQHAEYVPQDEGFFRTTQGSPVHYFAFTHTEYGPEVPDFYYYVELKEGYLFFIIFFGDPDVYSADDLEARKADYAAIVDSMHIEVE